MQTPDHDMRVSGEIIPFEPRKINESSLATTTIAALVAVTVLHDSSISPEDKLLDIIEQTGEAEVLETTDAFDAFEQENSDASLNLKPTASNDN